MRVDDVDVLVEGQGREAIVFIHGWPDTHRLWDPQVEALKDRYRCVRFTLPGFALDRPTRARSLDEMVATLGRIVEAACPGERVTLLVHDWGCFFGYQVWLATAWHIGGALGDRMARRMARWARAPAPPHEIGARMGWPYAVQWFKVKGGFGGLRAFDPQVPMLFFWGQRKPFLFHSQAWAEKLAARPHNRVIGLPTGHWVMVQRRDEFNTAVRQWLAETDVVVA